MKWLIFLIMGVLSMDLVNSEILNERQEQNCIGDTCTLISYQGDRFINDKGKLFTYSEYTNVSVYNKIITYTYQDGTIVTLTPYVDYSGTIKELNLLTSNAQKSIGFDIMTQKYRDNIKYTSSLIKVSGLNKVGFKVSSNKPITKINEMYIPSGVWDGSFNGYSVTDFIVGKARFSYRDLLDEGYLVTFDDINNIFWIDISTKTGRLNLDPTDSFVAFSSDGTIIIEELGACLSASSTSTIITVGDNHLVSPATNSYGELNFNTSLLPDDATITSARLVLYANSYGGTISLWNLTIQSRINNYGTLDCGDFFASSGDDYFNLGGTTGIKNISVKTSTIGVSNFTQYQLSPDKWFHVVNGRQANVNFRATEFGSNPPTLEVTYTLPSTESPKKINNEVYPILLVLSLILITIGGERVGQKESDNDETKPRV